jgi:hypothetical protein
MKPPSKQKYFLCHGALRGTHFARVIVSKETNKFCSSPTISLPESFGTGIDKTKSHSSLHPSYLEGIEWPRAHRTALVVSWGG